MMYPDAEAPPVVRDPDALRQLQHIESNDPDGGEREPTDADYARHAEWAIGTYGQAVWDRYRAGAWHPDCDPDW